MKRRVLWAALPRLFETESDRDEPRFAERASMSLQSRERPKSGETYVRRLRSFARQRQTSVVSCTMAPLVCVRSSCCRRRFWAVGRPKTLDRPSRGYHESLLSRNSSRTLSFLLSQRSPPLWESFDRGDEVLKKSFSPGRASETKPNSRASVASVETWRQRPTREASQQNRRRRKKTRGKTRITTSNRGAARADVQSSLTNLPTDSGTTTATTTKGKYEGKNSGSCVSRWENFNSSLRFSAVCPSVLVWSARNALSTVRHW